MRAWASPEKAWDVPIMAAMRSTMSTRIGEAKCRACAMMCYAVLCSTLLYSTTSHQSLPVQQSNRSALKRVPRRGPAQRKSLPC
jgi:hypothetical protein